MVSSGNRAAVRCGLPRTNPHHTTVEALRHSKTSKKMKERVQTKDITMNLMWESRSKTPGMGPFLVPTHKISQQMDTLLTEAINAKNSLKLCHLL